MPGGNDAAAAWAAIRELVEANDRRDELRAALGLGRGSGRVKALLALVGDRPRTLSDLADELAIDAPYATLIVNHLEALGLAQRAPDPADRRRRLVSVTERGAEAAQLARRIIDEPPAGLAALSPDELGQLRALLEKAVLHRGTAPSAQRDA